MTTTLTKPTASLIQSPHWVASMADQLRGKVSDRLHRGNLIIASHEICLRLAADGQREPTLTDIEAAAAEFLSALDGDEPGQINLITLRTAAELQGNAGIVESLNEEQAAEDAAAKAQEKVNSIRANREQTAQEIQHLNRQKDRTASRLQACDRDLDADMKGHLETVHRLHGTPEIRTVPQEASRYNQAVIELAHCEILKKVLPGLKNELTAELAQIEKRLTELSSGK